MHRHVLVTQGRRSCLPIRRQGGLRRQGLLGGRQPQWQRSQVPDDFQTARPDHKGHGTAMRPMVALWKVFLSNETATMVDIEGALL